MNTKRNYQIVLCRPQLAENVGAVARAASVMGFHNLTVIQPLCDILSLPALQLASHAFQVLRDADIQHSVQSLLKDNPFIVGFSARPRAMDLLDCSLPELSERLKTVNSERKVVLLFGSERTGLTNAELSYSHLRCFIPTFNEQYSSLNLAQAVQVVTYALAQDQYAVNQVNHRSEEVKQNNALRIAFDHYLESLTKGQLMNDFCERTTPERTLLKLRLLFNRSIQEEDDVKFLFGFFKALTKGMVQ